MGKVCWDFPLLGTGNQSGNNIAAITMFKGTKNMVKTGKKAEAENTDGKKKKR